jgi:hypothetical protein
VSGEQLPLRLSEDAAEEFTAALGQVIGGGFRLAEWGHDHGIPDALGLTPEDWAKKKLGGHILLSRAEKVRAVEHLTKKGLTVRDAADALGVPKSTLWDYQQLVRNRTAEAEAPDRGSQDAVRNRTEDAEGWLVEPCTECGKPTRRRWLHDEDEFDGRLLCDDCAEAVDQGTLVSAPPHVAENSGESEWYTPPEYIEAARAVMGDIDLDPASNGVANQIVQARMFLDASVDGLRHPWYGRIWLNPPYAQPLCSQFCEHLLGEFREERVSEACVLVNNATETAWFQALARRSAALCFPEGRIRFWHPERESAPLQGQAVLYFGPNALAFLTEFRDFGVVLEGRDA